MRENGNEAEPTNKEIASMLDRIGNLLDVQDANPHRVRSYHNGANRIRGVDGSVAEIVRSGDGDALRKMPDIGEGLAQVISNYVRTGRSPILERLQGEVSPEALFAQVPGVGEILAERIVAQLDIHTHVGDARATDMARAGMVNIGQLARDNYRDDGVYLVGFGSNRGSVIAGKSWGAPMERMAVPDSIPDSWESVLHHADGEDRLLLLDSVRDADAFVRRRGHRAIGVVYHPEREWGNFVPTSLPRRYDAFLYIDETEALNPLHLVPEVTGKPPETYPWGL